MTAGTGDGDGRTCRNCGKHKCGESPQSVLATTELTDCGDWTPKPQPQVAPIGDFSTCLLNIEKALSGLADIAESRSVTLGDAYGKLADGCIDAMEDVQVLRNQANGIEMDEDEAV